MLIIYVPVFVFIFIMLLIPIMNAYFVIKIHIIDFSIIVFLKK